MRLGAVGASRAVLGGSRRRTVWLFPIRIGRCALWGLLHWVAVCRWEGTALQPEQCSLATERGHYPPQKVPDTKIWGSALTLQLVVKGWGMLEAQCC